MPNSLARQKPFNADCAVFIAAFLLFLALPLLLNLWFSDEWSAAYRVFARNFLGAHYKIPLETPKPVMMVLSSVLPPWSNWPLAAALAGLFAACVFKIARLLGGGLDSALFAAGLCLLGNNQFFAEFFFGGTSYSPLVYLPLLSLQMVFYLQGKYRAAFLLNFVTSLIRPESWFCAAIFFIDRLRNKDAKNFIYYLPLLAPLIWMFCDWRISGDCFLSYRLTSEYIDISAVPGTAAHEFWPLVLNSLGTEYGRAVIFLGFFALLLRAGKSRVKHEGVFIGCIVAPFLAYWLISFRKDFVVMTRFFSWSALMLTIYAAVILARRFEGKRPFAYANILYLSVLAFFCLNNLDFGNMVMRLRVQQLARAATAEMTQFLAQHPVLAENSQQLMVPARRCGDFALAAGEKQSQKFIYFREVLGPKKVKLRSGTAFYVDYTARGFNFLAEPKSYYVTVRDERYVFVPHYVTRNGLGVIYSYAPADK